MADAISPIAVADLNNVNCNIAKPDTSKCTKDLMLNKDDMNQNKDYDKCSSSDKFRNSPLLADKKQSPGISPTQGSSALNERKIINSPVQTLVGHVKSPPPLAEEKILNSPISGRNSGQEFRLVNPTSRSASVSSQFDSVNLSQSLPARAGDASDRDSLGDDELMELLSDDLVSENVAVMSPHETIEAEDKADSINDEIVESQQETLQLVSERMDTDHDILSDSGDTGMIENSSAAVRPLAIDSMGDVDESGVCEPATITNQSTLDLSSFEMDLANDSITALAMLEADDFSDSDKLDSVNMIRLENSIPMKSEDAWNGLLEIADCASGEFSLTSDDFDNMSRVMTAWIDESVDNLKGMVKKTIQTPSKPIIPQRSLPKSVGKPSKLQCHSKIMRPTRGALVPPSPVQTSSPARNLPPHPVQTSSPIRKSEQYTDSPLSRFHVPSHFEQKLAAKLAVETFRDREQTSDTGGSPLQYHRRGSKPTAVSQSASGDFTGSSRASPAGDYSHYNSESNYSTERSYTASYTSFTPSDESDNSESPLYSPDGATPAREMGRARGQALHRPRLPRAQRIVESSSAESFMSARSDDEPQTVRASAPAGLKKPARGGLARPRVNSATMPRPARKQQAPETSPAERAVTRPRTAPKSAKPSAKASPARSSAGASRGSGTAARGRGSGIQRPTTGIQKPTGIQRPAGRGIPKPGVRGKTSGLAGSVPKKSAHSTNSWDEGCY